MYAVLDVGQKTVRAVLKRQDGKIVKELKIKKQADSILKFLKGRNTNVVMESGYDYQYLYLLYCYNWKSSACHRSDCTDTVLV